MSITARTSGGYFSSGTSGALNPVSNATFNVSFSSVATDAVVLFIGVNSAGAALSNPPIQAPASGWTSIGSAVVAVNTSTASVIIQGWVCYGSNTNFTFKNISGHAVDAVWMTQAFTGVDQTTIVDSTPASQGTSTGGSSAPVPSWNVVNAGALVVAGAVDWNGNTNYNASGYTGPAGASNYAGSASTATGGMIYANSAVGSAGGATGSFSFSDSGSPNGSSGNFMATMALALKPAGGGSTSYQPYRDYSVPFWNWYEF